MMQALLSIPFVSKNNKFLDLVCSFQLDVNLYNSNLHFHSAAIGTELNFGSQFFDLREKKTYTLPAAPTFTVSQKSPLLIF